MVSPSLSTRVVAMSASNSSAAVDERPSSDLHSGKKRGRNNRCGVRGRGAGCRTPAAWSKADCGPRLRRRDGLHAFWVRSQHQPRACSFVLKCHSYDQGVMSALLSAGQVCCVLGLRMLSTLIISNPVREGLSTGQGRDGPAFKPRDTAKFRCRYLCMCHPTTLSASSVRNAHSR